MWQCPSQEHFLLNVLKHKPSLMSERVSFLPISLCSSLSNEQCMRTLPTAFYWVSQTGKMSRTLGPGSILHHHILVALDHERCQGLIFFKSVWMRREKTSRLFQEGPSCILKAELKASPDCVTFLFLSTLLLATEARVQWMSFECWSCLLKRCLCFNLHSRSCCETCSLRSSGPASDIFLFISNC